MVYINMRMRAKHNIKLSSNQYRRYGKIYHQEKLVDKGHVSLSTKETYNVEGISRSNGITIYRTSAKRDRPFLKHVILISKNTT